MSVTFTHDTVTFNIPHVVWAAVMLNTRQWMLRRALKCPICLPSSFTLELSLADYNTMLKVFAETNHIEPNQMYAFSSAYLKEIYQYLQEPESIATCDEARAMPTPTDEGSVA